MLSTKDKEESSLFFFISVSPLATHCYVEVTILRKDSEMPFLDLIRENGINTISPLFNLHEFIMICVVGGVCSDNK